MGCVGSEIQRSKPTLRAEKYGEANTFGGAGKPGQKFRNKEGREGEIESLANRIVNCVILIFLNGAMLICLLGVSVFTTL